MTKEKLEELGWKFDQYWNNRAFYSLSEESKFAIFEHGDWGIMDPFSKEFKLIYCNLSDEEIEEYTNLIKVYENIIRHPKDNTLYAYLVATEEIVEFIKKVDKRS